MATAIRMISIDEVRPHPDNPKGHDIDLIRESLRRFGFTSPLLVCERTGFLAAGHGRRSALLAERGEGRPPPQGIRKGGGNDWLVPVVTGWSSVDDAELLAYLVADNQTTIAGEWDNAALASILERVNDGPGLLGTGFDGDTLKDLLGSLVPEEQPGAPDDVPEAPTAAATRRGDIWECGPHRIMCGDSTSRDDLVLLMGGELAAMMFTDPPYGVGYDGGTTTREKLIGDEIGTDVYAKFLAAVPAVLDPRAPIYLFFAGSHALDVFTAVVANNYRVRALMVWHKTQAHYGALSAQYKLKHEPFLYCHRRGQAPYWYGPTNEVTVWEVDQSHRNEWHPTQKPVALAERALGNSSRHGDLVIDPFGGSGSTMIAAERAGRVARLMEIEPRYVDVVARRFLEYSGIDPVRQDGRKWSDLDHPMSTEA